MRALRLRPLILAVSLFSFGVFLSGVVLYFFVEDPQVVVPARREEAPVVRISNDLEDSLRRSLPVGKGLHRLLGALDDGKQRSLQLIRQDFLKSVPNYEIAVLPSIKERALTNLLSRFSASDWEDWPRAAYAENGAPSQARLYLDDISAVNRDLGVFLETAAQLLHGLFLNTRYGRVYDLEQGMQYIVTNADRLLAYRSNTANPARLLLLPSVAIDPAFLRPFEQARGRLVAERILKRPGELSTNLDLLASLSPQFCEPDVFGAVVGVLGSLSRDASAGLRNRVLSDESKLETLLDFAHADTRVKRALAQLYSVAAVDALEEHNLRLAQGRYLDSLSLASNLKSQAYVKSFLMEYGLERDLPLRSAAVLSDREKMEQAIERSIDKSADSAGAAVSGYLAARSSSFSWVWSGFKFLVLLTIALVCFGGVGYGGYLLFRRFHDEEYESLGFGADVGSPDLDLQTYDEWNIDDLRVPDQAGANRTEEISPFTLGEDQDSHPELRLIKSANG